MRPNAATLAAGFDQRYREIIHAGSGAHEFNYFRGTAPAGDVDAVCAVAGEWTRLKDVMKLAGFTKGRTVLALDSAVRAVMKGVASEHPELPLAEIALQLIKRMDAAGHDPMPFAAAFVDECESMDAK